MARTSVKSLLGSLIDQVKASPVPIRSIELDGTKIKRIEFGGQTGADPVVQQAGGERHSPPKLVAGTEIPDDGTPLDSMDTVLNPPTYAVEDED